MSVYPENDFQTWVLDQGYVWIDKYGQPHLLEEMNYLYLKKVKKFLQRNLLRFYRYWCEVNEEEAIEQKLWLQQRILFKQLTLEIQRRDALLGFGAYPPKEVSLNPNLRESLLARRANG
jgi:hypothetical protein